VGCSNQAAQALRNLGQQAVDEGLPGGIYGKNNPIEGTTNGVPVEVTGKIDGGIFQLGTA
jgi:hypothetical protein